MVSCSVKIGFWCIHVNLTQTEGFGTKAHAVSDHSHQVAVFVETESESSFWRIATHAEKLATQVIFILFSFLPLGPQGPNET